MPRYVLKRIGQALLTAFITITVVFVLLRLAPGDPAYEYASPNATPAQLDAIRAAFGLNQGIVQQYGTFLLQLLHGNVGQSYEFQTSAMSVVLERLPYTVTLAVSSIVLTAIVSIPLGVWMARRDNTGRELTANVTVIAGQSMPDFWLALMLILVFALNLRWFPPSGFTSIESLVLPTVTVTILQVALISRLVRREMVGNLTSQYVTIGRARGVSERRLMWGYAFRNSTIPVVTALGTRFAAMLNGVVVVEVVFQWPGVGSLVVNALNARDFPLIEATVIVTVLLALTVQLVIDLLYPMLDPRVKLGKVAAQ